MGTRDRARQLHGETELLRVLVATLMTEVDALVPATEDGRRTRIDVLARMITSTAADVSAELERLGAPETAAPDHLDNVVELPRGEATLAGNHPVFRGAAGGDRRATARK